MDKAAKGKKAAATKVEGERKPRSVSKSASKSAERVSKSKGRKSASKGADQKKRGRKSASSKDP